MIIKLVGGNQNFPTIKNKIRKRAFIASGVLSSQLQCQPIYYGKYEIELRSCSKESSLENARTTPFERNKRILEELVELQTPTFLDKKLDLKFYHDIRVTQ